MSFSAMSLGTWLSLFGGFGSAIVLLYLLRLRRRRVEVPFGPLWQKVLAEKQTTSYFKVLKNLLSLLIQLAVLALVLTALADPRWTGDSLIAEAAPRELLPSHTLLVVDGSASMATLDADAKDRMTAARAEARRVIDAMRPGEVIMLARMDRDVTVLTDWTSDRDALRAAVDALEAHDTATALDPVIAFARDAVRWLEDAQVLLVTDRELPPPDPRVMADLKLRALPVGSGKHQDNLAILDFSVRSHLGNQLRYALHYTLKNVSERPVKVAVSLYSDPLGKAKSRSDFLKMPPARAPFVHELAAGEEKSFDQLEIDLDGPRAALLVHAYDQPRTDAFQVDDIAYAVVPERRTVKVQLVGPDNLFLMAALSTRRGVEVKAVPLEGFQGTTGYDLTVFSGGAPAELPKGNLIFVNVGAGALPFGVGKPIDDVDSLLVPQAGKDHPVMAFVRFVDLEVPRLLPLERKKGHVQLARTKAGAAAVLAGSTAEMRFVGIGFDPVDSEWVGHFSFSIFFVNAVNWFFQEESSYLRAQSLVDAWRVKLPWTGGKALVTTPDGRTIEALVDGAGGLAYTGDRAGIYEVRPENAADATPVLVPAALGSREESSLDPRGDYTVWSPPIAEEGELPELRFGGLLLWQLLALIAAGLLLVEWFTFHRRWTV